MFTFSQPPDQNQGEQHQLPVVDIPDSPEVVDMILRLIYPGVEPPKITELSVVSALLSATTKYNITSTTPFLRGALKTLSPGDRFGAYIIACRFGFPEEAREAAMASTVQSLFQRDYDKDMQLISSADLLRIFKSARAKGLEEELGIDDLSAWYDQGCPPIELGEIPVTAF